MTTTPGTLALEYLTGAVPTKDYMTGAHFKADALADLRALMAAAMLWEQCAGDWKARAEAAEADNARLRAALADVVAVLPLSDDSPLAIAARAALAEGGAK